MAESEAVALRAKLDQAGMALMDAADRLRDNADKFDALNERVAQLDAVVRAARPLCAKLDHPARLHDALVNLDRARAAALGLGS